MSEILPHEVYTTTEAEKLLKVSRSTIKRLLKKGILRANKLGGNYRILGKEMLRVISPQVEKKAVTAYLQLKKKTIRKIKNW